MSDTSAENISIGYGAGQNQAGGSYGIYMGRYAGHASNGDYNIFLGHSAGKSCVGTNNIEFITFGNGNTSILDDYSNKIHIENTIVGDTDTRRLAIGLVGVGDVSPDATLEIKPSGTTTVGMIVQAAASHTASLTEWQNSSEAVLASVAADGAISASGAITAATGIALQRNTPAVTTDKLYNVGGDLYFDGSEVGGGGGTSYTAGTGLTLVGTEFNTAGTGHFDNIRFTDNQIKIGEDIGADVGQYSISIGFAAGEDCLLGNAQYSVFLGYGAGSENEGQNNLCIGPLAGAGYGVANNNNTCIGYFAGRDGNGNSNTLIGDHAGYQLNGDRNIILGKGAGRAIVGDQNIEIATESATAATNWKSILFESSNKINIAYSEGSVLVGDLATQRLAIGGVGTGDLSPDATLEIKPSGATDVGLIVQGATSQSANLTEWQDSSETVLAKIDSAGNLTATSKSFLIDHPTQEGKQLQYGSLEGPEHGVYARGYTDTAIIDLPEYWTELVDEASITVHITPKDFAQPNLFVSKVMDNKVYLQSDGDISSYYIVNGTRKDIDPLEIEPEG